MNSCAPFTDRLPARRIPALGRHIGCPAALALLLALLASLVLSEAAQAESVPAPGAGARAAARIDLLVTIPEILRLRTAPPALQEITSEDIQRGWVQATLNLEVTSNARAGFLLALRTDPRWVEHAEIDGLGGTLDTAAGGAFVRLTHHGSPHKQQDYALRLRVRLKPGLAPGRYPAPLSVSLSA